MGKQAKRKASRRTERETAVATNPLSSMGRYVDATTVFGHPMPAEELVGRIRTFDWRSSFLRLAHLAAAVSRDRAGPRSRTIDVWARTALRGLTGSADRLIVAARRWAASGDDGVIVHEEGIDFVQHLVLLHGGDDGDAPADPELALWLLGAADYLGAWEDADNRPLSSTEQLIAEQVRVARFNNSEDPLNLLVRSRDMYAKRPFAGALSDPATWAAVERAAFGCDFATHFETRVLPLFAESLSWGSSERVPPLVVPQQWVASLAPDVRTQIAVWLFDQSRTRDELVTVTRQRMRPDGLLPQAPTALLRHPIVRIADDRVAFASPWRVRTHLKTGMWAAFLQATKDTLGGKRAQEWTIGFGYQFEDWLRTVADHAAESARFLGHLELPRHPGSDDEIEDVVVVEGRTAILFSGKARLVEEPVARHAKSRAAVLDWYAKFFFAPGGSGFRDGVVKQLSDRIDMVREGRFEARLPRDYSIVPVLVTYDSLCEEFLLYQWLHEQCVERGLLQQRGVAPLVLAHIDDYERLMARASRGLSLTSFFRAREGHWRNRRLQVQLGATRPDDRLPHSTERFSELMASVSKRLFRPRLTQ